MTDLFEEVEEQIRSDRVRTLALKALPWVAGLVAVILVVVGGVWGWRAYETKAANTASEQYAAGLDAFSAGDNARAAKIWTEVSTSHARAYRSLALMQLAGLQLAAGKTAEGVKLMDQAAEAAPDVILGDLARLKSALALLDTAPFAEVEGRLTPLLKDEHPYRSQAREALAYAKLLKGDLPGARSDLAVISQSLDAPAGARERAKKAMEVIDSGSAKALAAIVRASIALPPAAAAPVPAQPQASGPQ